MSRPEAIDIQAICFDVGGVLLTNGWDRYERAAVLQHFSLDSQAYESRHEIPNDAWEKGFMTAEQYLARTVFYEPMPFTPAEFIEEMKAQSKVLPNGALRILKELRSSNRLKLVILNNEARELNDFRIERFELHKYFDAFLSSCYVGLRKPDKQMFKLAIDVLRRQASQIAFVDDRMENCAAACGMGMQAICYQNEEQLAQAFEKLGLSVPCR